MTCWTREEYDCLRELAALGLSAAQIMKALNERFGHDRTRNAIIGASHRIRVTVGTPNVGAIRYAAMRKARGPRKTKPKPIPKIILLPEKPMSEPEQIIVKSSKKNEPPWGVSDLTSRTCRWIDGDPSDPRPFACTQEKAFEKPYCAAHLKRAFGSSHKGRMIA